MKNNILILSFLVLLMVSCSSDDDAQVVNLTPENGQITATINGNPFRSDADDNTTFALANSINASQQITSVLSVTGGSSSDNSAISFSITTGSIDFASENAQGSYTTGQFIDGSQNVEAAVVIVVDGVTVEASTNEDVIVTISDYDLENRLISGIFTFVATDGSEEFVVENGTFINVPFNSITSID